MDRVVDVNQFVAEGAVVNWESAWSDQEAALAKANRPPREPSFAGPFGLQLRWYVSKTAGVPPQPFTVWSRQDKDSLAPLVVRTVRDADSTWISWDGPPLLTLEVSCQPFSPTLPTALWAFRTDAKLTSAVAVSPTRVGAGPFSLAVRSGSISFARLVNADVLSARAVGAESVAVGGAWEELEIVGLPYDPGAWAGLDYDGPQQGLVASLVDPFDAAVARLKRAAPPFGWFPVTESGHLAPPWTQPDPGGLVDGVRADLLGQVGDLFRPGTDPAQQVQLRAEHDVSPPQQDGRVAVVQSSKAQVPLLGALLVAANTDPFLALAGGFGTGYLLTDEHERLNGSDLMVTAPYPKGVGGRPALEYAWVVPAQAPHHRMSSPGALTARRSGLLDPTPQNAPWRETVKLEWDAMPPSYLLSRAAGVAAARYDPPDLGTPAASLLDERPSGGPQPLAPVRQPPPHSDRVALVDPGRELPPDGSVATTGYAVAQQDPFGVWSPWEDVAHSGQEPNPSVPVVSDVVFTSTFAGSAICPAELAVTVTVDWSARSPVFLQVPVVIAPVPFPGAATPAGVTPFDPPPAGARRFDLTVQFNLDEPDPLTAALEVDPLAADDDRVVAAGSDQGVDSRRYRLRVSGQTLDFTSVTHYVAVVWAREVALGRPAFGDVSPLPMRGFASSLVPIVVPAVPLPIVPLGSLPDAEGRSHVALRLSGLPGAVKLVVWTASEGRIRQLAGEGAIPPGSSLSTRFVALKAAFNDLDPAQRREAFARVRELPPGPASSDHALPRGSREIQLFTVTGVTGANVESPWPTNIDQFQAAAAPTLVRPEVPELSAFLVASGGGEQVQLSMVVRSRVAVAAFEVHRTYLSGATASTGRMGPPVASVAAVAAAVASVPETPAGRRFEATFVDPAPGDWRPAHYRVVAVPQLSVEDREQGRVGARSADSSLASILLAPPDPPDLVVDAIADWAADRTGVVVRLTTDAPLDVGTLGPFRLTVDGGAVVSLAEALSAIPEASVTTPPAAVGAGSLTRTARVARRTTVAVWFSRSSPAVPVELTVTLVDPLGRARTAVVSVPALPLAPPPEIAITSVEPSGTAVVLSFTTNVSAQPEPEGDAVLDVNARRSVFPLTGASLRVAVPDIPDLPELPLNPPGQVVVARRRLDAGEVDYVVLVRLARPFRISVAVTDNRGRTATAVRQIPAGPP